MSEKLNEEQLAAVNADPAGVTLVRALAGSGKTRVLRHRVQRLIQLRNTQGYNDSKILITAFNASVADELRVFFSTALKPEEFKRLMVKTAHGVATSMLFRYMKASNITADRIEIPKTFHLVQQIQDYLQAEFGEHLDQAKVRMLLELDGEARVKNLPILKFLEKEGRALKSLDMKPKKVELLTQRMKAFRLSTGNLTHNDTIPLANELPSSCFKHMGFRDVLADELQDLNAQQRMLIHNFVKHAEGFTGVGDENQSVYGFQSADPNIFKNLMAQYPEAKILTLSTNYRSTDEVLSLANTILHKEIKTDQSIVGTSRRGPKPVTHSGGPGDVLTWLNELRSKSIKPEQTCLLYRTRKDCPELEAMLVSNKIPYVLKDNSFFEDAVVQDIVSYLNILYNPVASDGDWRRLFNHYPGIGYATAAYTWAMTKGKPLYKLPLSDYPAPVKRLKAYKEWDKFQYDLIKLNGMKGDPVATVVEHLISTLTPYWEKAGGHGGSRGIEDRLMIAKAFLSWVQSFAGTVTGWDVVKTIDSIERGVNRNKDRTDALHVMTVHKSKGLQWDAVGLWNCKDGAFPLNGDSVDHAEERRLLYVAVTRTKTELAIFTNGEVSTLGSLNDPSEEFKFPKLFKSTANDPFLGVR